MFCLCWSTRAPCLGHPGAACETGLASAIWSYVTVWIIATTLSTMVKSHLRAAPTVAPTWH
eukprot:11975938-Alexandrium_andersonii.AAC.1